MSSISQVEGLKWWMVGVELEEFSRRLLNGDHRLEFVGAVVGLSGAQFTTGELQAVLGWKDTLVSKELRHFVAVGLLRKVRHGTYEVRYRDWWIACRDLAHEKVPATRRANLRAIAPPGA